MGLVKEAINMNHGAGGKAMHQLLKDIIFKALEPVSLEVPTQEDQASFDIATLQALGNRLAFTTDSFVVDPLFFPGGDIGKLAIAGTVNDLAVGGATPLYLTCSLILEEGLDISVLEKVLESMRITAQQANVKIVTGDTKVVPRGACDKLFINTAGIGVIPENTHIVSNAASPGDLIIINGYVGDHGAAIVDARGELALENTIETDCAPLNDLIATMLSSCPKIKCMRDVTRGGLLTVLNEFAQASQCGININESEIPVRTEVRGICEILGLDPLYLANEGKVVAIVPADFAEELIIAMRKHPLGQQASIIGEVIENKRSQVTLTTSFGTQRIVDVLVGDQLPRIC